MLQILHLEDNRDDAFLIGQALAKSGIEATLTITSGRAEFQQALEQKPFDLVLADSGLPAFNGLEALKLLRQKRPETNLIVVSGAASEREARLTLEAGATDYVNKEDLARLVATIKREEERLRLIRTNQRRSRLVTAVQELSLARDLDTVMAIVRHAARELTGADGATFILRDGDLCHYAEENAIAPLWKGQRFPMAICASGWVMLNRSPVVIEDIYADPRIPADAYRPTFVKSLAMVPIRTENPVGAIGNYWGTRHLATPEEVELLQALANTTAVAMENVCVHEELEQRVKDRTVELQVAVQELESFAEAVAHDLGAPLRSIRGFAKLVLQESGATLSAAGRDYLARVQNSAAQMRELIDELLRLSRVARSELKADRVDLSALARDILAQLAAGGAERTVEIIIADAMVIVGDPALFRIALENLLSNAWKYTAKSPNAKIEFGMQPQADGTTAYYIRDNGAGFNMEYAGKLFQPFQRLHTQEEFTGSGIGLTTVQRIIHRHGGRIWAEAQVNKGATFYFALAAVETASAPHSPR